MLSSSSSSILNSAWNTHTHTHTHTHALCTGAATLPHSQPARVEESRRHSYQSFANNINKSSTHVPSHTETHPGEHEILVWLFCSGYTCACASWIAWVPSHTHTHTHTHTHNTHTHTHKHRDWALITHRQSRAWGTPSCHTCSPDQPHPPRAGTQKALTPPS